MDDSRKTKKELLKELNLLRPQLEEWKNLAQKRKEMVEESEAKFLQLTENIEEVFWMDTPGARDGHFVSRSFEKIWGRPREELYKNPRRTFLESIHPDDRRRVEQWTVDHKGPIQYRIVRPDGSVRWINDRRFSLHDEQGTVRKVIGIALDLTSLRERFAKFQQAAKAAAMERLVSFVAHEVRNPLQVIRGGVETLEMRMGKDRRDEDILDELHYGVTAVADIINQIPCRRPGQELRPDHEGRQDIQERTSLKEEQISCVLESCGMITGWPSWSAGPWTGRKGRSRY
jgi:PAS domain S-box-containing protein